MLAILGGGLLTWLMQEKGSVRISQGERVAFFEREGGGMTSLPKELSLERFEVVYYPGGMCHVIMYRICWWMESGIRCQ